LLKVFRTGWVRVNRRIGNASRNGRRHFEDPPLRFLLLAADFPAFAPASDFSGWGFFDLEPKIWSHPEANFLLDPVWTV
jgi:hypothetical protein